MPKKGKYTLKTVSVTIPEGYLKKISEEVIAEVVTPEEVINLGEGVDLIVKEGKTMRLIEEKYELEIPGKDPQLPSGKEKKGGRRESKG